MGGRGVVCMDEVNVASSFYYYIIRRNSLWWNVLYIC